MKTKWSWISFLSIISLFLMMSCGSGIKDYKKLIIGKWKLVSRYWDISNDNRKLYKPRNFTGNLVFEKNGEMSRDITEKTSKLSYSYSATYKFSKIEDKIIKQSLPDYQGIITYHILKSSDPEYKIGSDKQLYFIIEENRLTLKFRGVVNKWERVK